MSVDHPKNELYDDFVQMVDKVSSAVIKETSQPIAEQIRIATAAMDKTLQVLRKTSTEIDVVTSAAIKEVSSQTQSTTQILKKTSDEIGSVASKAIQVAISPVAGHIQDATRLLKKTTDEIGTVATCAIKDAIAPITGQIQNTTVILKKTTDEIGATATQAIQSAIAPVAQRMDSTALVMKQASTDIEKVYSGVSYSKDKINEVSAQIDKKSASIEGQIKVTSDATAQKVDGAVTQLKKDNAALKTQVESVGDVILKRIDNDLKVALSQNFSFIRKDFESIKEQNKTLQNQIAAFQQKQEKLLYWVLGVTSFFGMSIIAIVVFALRGMK